MSKLLKLFNDLYSRNLAAANQPYNDNSNLDVYVDHSQSIDTRKIIIFWHGGSWINGDKSIYRSVGDYLARATGAVVIIPNYQKYPQITQPQFIEEAWQVVQWATDHAKEHQATIDNYSVIGHSSGAHTAASVALGYKKPTTLQPPSRCIDLAGPNCFITEQFYPVFGEMIGQAKAFPNDHVADIAPDYATKFLLLHGRFDKVVFYRQQTLFAKTLKDHNVKVSTGHPWATHTSLIIVLGSPFGNFGRIAHRVVSFLKD